MALTLLLLIL